MVLPTNEIKIEIADICVALRCDNARFIERVERRYEGFLSTRSPLVTVDALITESLKGETSLDVLTSLSGSKASFTSYGAAGHVDTAKGIGQLELTPFAALRGRDAVDNFISLLYSLLCVRNNGFLSHAAGVVKEGKGYLFFGHAGSGKTTVCELSADCAILSDELVSVRAINGTWRAFGTPFWGDVQEGGITNESAEIKGVFGLVQDTEVYLERLNCPRAVAELMSSVPVVCKDPSLGKDLMDLCTDVVRKIPCYRMHFLPDDSFWRYIDELA